MATNDYFSMRAVLIRALGFARSKSHLMRLVGIDPKYIEDGSFSLWIHDHNQISYDRQQPIRVQVLKREWNHGIEFRSSVLNKLYSRLPSFNRLHLMRLIKLLYFSVLFMILRIIHQYCFEL